MIKKWFSGFIGFMKYILSKVDVYLYIILLVVSSGAFCLIKTLKAEFYDNLLSPIMGTVAILFGLFIWTVQQKNLYKESIPKRLTVHFKLGNEYICSCYEAWLAHEGDLRNWGQQIGMQMMGYQLNMHPYITAEKPKIIKSFFEQNKRIQLYEVTFHLYKNDSNEDSNIKEIFLKPPPDNDLKDFIKEERYIAWYRINPDTIKKEVYKECKSFITEKMEVSKIIAYEHKKKNPQ